MRRDAAGLRTWLLAGMGGWALLLWAASLFGLGSRLGSGDVGASAAPLPQVPQAPAPVVLDNAEAMARPLFAGDRRPHPFSIGQPAETDSTGSVRLTGVLMTPSLEMATLTTEQGQSLRLRLGAEPENGWQLLSLQPRAAVVSGPAGTLNLELHVYSGNRVAPQSGIPGDAAAPLGGGTAGAVPPPPPPPPADSPSARAAAAARAANAAAEAASDAAGPSAAQIQAIRERIQARRRQAQQNQNGSSGSPKP